MSSQSVLLRFLCLSLSALAANSHLPIAALPFYGPQVPYVAASVKSPPVVASVKAPIHAPLPPVRAKIGVKTVVRPNPAPIVVPPPSQVVIQQPVPVIEQHELVMDLTSSSTDKFFHVLLLVLWITARSARTIQLQLRLQG